MYNEGVKVDDKIIYRGYLQSKADPSKTAQDVCNKFGISRPHLYNVVRRVQNGNPSAIRKALEESRLQILWDYKYKVRFEALPNDRKDATVQELRIIIKAMEKDRFPKVRISHFIKRDRSTVIHHLKN